MTSEISNATSPIARRVSLLSPVLFAFPIKFDGETGGNSERAERKGKKEEARGEKVVDLWGRMVGNLLVERWTSTAEPMQKAVVHIHGQIYRWLSVVTSVSGNTLLSPRHTRPYVQSPRETFRIARATGCYVIQLKLWLDRTTGVAWLSIKKGKRKSRGKKEKGGQSLEGKMGAAVLTDATTPAQIASIACLQTRLMIDLRTSSFIVESFSPFDPTRRRKSRFVESWKLSVRNGIYNDICNTPSSFIRLKHFSLNFVTILWKLFLFSKKRS